MRCCLGLVTVKAMPFRLFDDDQYFKKLIDPYEKAFVDIASRLDKRILGTNAQIIKNFDIKMIE